jgi:MFS family permease
MASLMVFSLLPTFLIDELHVSKREIGFIEGVAVFIAFLTKVFSGVFSDIFKTRRKLIIAGILGTALVKPLFALSSGMWSVFMAKSLDRFSKGIRSAPADALIVDISPKTHQGSSYGMRYTMETAGAVIGAGAAFLIFHFSANYRAVFWCSMIPAFVAFVVLFKFVHDTGAMKQHVSWQWKDIRYLPKRYWQILGGIFILMQARFSEAFLNIRAKEMGWAVASLPLLIVGYNIICANTAWPTGKLADRTNRLKVLFAGLMVLVIANIIMIISPNKWWILSGILLCGLHMGMTHGMLSTLIAENTLPHLRGTAFAIYYLVTGFSVLIGNNIAGFLAEHIHAGAFYGGLVFTSIAGVYFYILSKN